jgi:hypothetical protein
MRINIIKCDCCSAELKEQEVYVAEPLMHIFSESSLAGHVQIKNGEILRVSKRQVSIDLCLSCYNQCWGAFVDKFNLLKNQ